MHTRKWEELFHSRTTDIKNFKNIEEIHFGTGVISFSLVKSSQSLNFCLKKLTTAKGFSCVTILIPRGIKADEILVSELALRGCKFLLPSGKA